MMTTPMDVARLRALCSELVGRFYRAVDTGDDAAAGSAFGDKGSWLRQGVPLTGAAEVEAALAQRTPGRRTCHSVSNLVVDPQPDGDVELRYHVSVWVQEPEAPAAIAAILDCHDIVDVAGERPLFRSKRSAIHLRFDQGRSTFIHSSVLPV